MPLNIVRNDISKMEVDAVVLPANPWLEKGRGSSTALFEAAGEEELATACEAIGYVEYGHVVMTDGFNLPAKYIIHAVVPYWEDNVDAPKELYSCYIESLERAYKCGFESIAFPLLSSGSFKCPKAEAIKIANYAFNKFFETYGFDTNMAIYLVLYDKESFDAAGAFYEDIDSYIDEHYVEAQAFSQREQAFTMTKNSETSQSQEQPYFAPKQVVMPSGGATLDELISRAGENFRDAFVRYVRESGMDNPEIYGRASISKALFSKIMCNADYHPKKETILALSFAMRLTLQDAEYLLMKAGHALTDYSKFDIVCRYFLEKGVHDVLTINEVLFDYGLELLGNTIA